MLQTVLPTELEEIMLYFTGSAEYVEEQAATIAFGGMKNKCKLHLPWKLQEFPSYETRSRNLVIVKH